MVGGRSQSSLASSAFAPPAPELDPPPNSNGLVGAFPFPASSFGRFETCGGGAPNHIWEMSVSTCACDLGGGGGDAAAFGFAPAPPPNQSKPPPPPDAAEAGGGAGEGLDGLFPGFLATSFFLPRGDVDSCVPDPDPDAKPPADGNAAFGGDDAFGGDGAVVFG